MATRRARPTKPEPPILQLRVQGPGIRSGRIAVPDLINICQEAQNVVNRQAEALEGRKTIHPGPTTSVIQHECTLELIGIKKGSTTLQFGLAKPQLTLDFDEIHVFGANAVGELAANILSLGNGNKRHIDPGVLQGIYALGNIGRQRGISAIEWIAPKSGSRKRISAPLNETVRERAAARLSAPRRAVVEIDGVLDMADFKPKDKKCRIDPAIGASINCSFDDKHADLIYSLLRKPVIAKGEATLQPYTERIESLRITEIELLPSLSLGKGNFLLSPSIRELASAQEVAPLKDISVLAGGFPDDENIDDFLEEVYASRK